MTEAETRADSMAPEENGAGGGTKNKSETPYPYFSLAHAIKMLAAVRKTGGTDAPSADVMRELGIEKSTDRLWSYGVPSAVQFGLIERIGRGDTGRLKATELGLRLTYHGTPEEERAAKVAAFRTPALYVKLLERYAGADVPTKEGLKNILFRDYGIVESMTTMAAEAFIDSLTVAGLLTANNKITLGSDTPQGDPSKKQDAKVESADPPGMKSVLVPQDFVVYRCKISKGRVLEIPLPKDFTQKDADRMYAFLKTQIDDDGEEVPT